MAKRLTAEGGVTIVQDESTSTIYIACPGRWLKTVDADFVLPLERIGDAVVRAVMKLKQRVGSL